MKLFRYGLFNRQANKDLEEAFSGLLRWRETPLPAQRKSNRPTKRDTQNKTQQALIIQALNDGANPNRLMKVHDQGDSRRSGQVRHMTPLALGIDLVMPEVVEKLLERGANIQNVAQAGLSVYGINHYEKTSLDALGYWSVGVVLASRWLHPASAIHHKFWQDGMKIGQIITNHPDFKNLTKKEDWADNIIMHICQAALPWRTELLELLVPAGIEPERVRKRIEVFPHQDGWAELNQMMRARKIRAVLVQELADPEPGAANVGMIDRPRKKM